MRTPYSPGKILRQALFLNGLFSGVSGLLLVVMNGPLVTVLGIGSPLMLAILGAVLLLFSMGLILNARRPEISRGEAILASILDLAWVVGSIFLLVGAPQTLSPAGYWAVILVAEVVALFATFQLFGLWRSRSLPVGQEVA